MSRADEFLEALQSEEKPAAKKNRQWRALLGQVLEYGDSGFTIVLQKTRTKSPFQGRDPEGRIIGETDNLTAMKRYIEDQAKFRDEFQPSGDDMSLMPDFKRYGGEQ